jgi:O-antigen/teichoic acid export membrane protein
MLIFVMVVANLGVGQGGVYNLALAYFFLASRFAFWGLDQILTREVAKDRVSASRYISNLLYARVGLALITITITLLVVQLANYDSETTLVISLLLLSVLPENINNLIWGGFAAFEEYQLTSISAIVSLVIKVSLAFALLKLGFPLPAIMVAILTGYLGAMFVNLLIVRKRYLSSGWERPDLTFIRGQLRLATPFFFIGMFFILDNRLDVILLAALDSELAVGLYGAATTVIAAFSILPEGYRIAVLPVMTRFHSDNDSALRDLYERSFKYLLAIAVPLTVTTILLAQDLISLIYRQDMPEASTTLRILAIGMAFSFLIVVNNRLLIVYNRQALIARILIATTITNIIVNLLLDPQYGAVGAAIARISSLALLLLLTTFSSSRFIAGVRRARYVWRPLLSSTIMAIVIWQLTPFGFWIQLAAGATTYVVILLLVGTFSTQELNVLRELSKKLIAR